MLTKKAAAPKIKIIFLTAFKKFSARGPSSRVVKICDDRRRALRLAFFLVGREMWLNDPRARAADSSSFSWRRAKFGDVEHKR